MNGESHEAKASLFALLIAPAASLLVSAGPPLSDREQVRERRLAYTAAIEARRPDLMRSFLATDMVQLSSNGESNIGRDAVVLTYSKHEFLDRSFIVYGKRCSQATSVQGMSSPMRFAG
jgi:hypothetical protein